MAGRPQNPRPRLLIKAMAAKKELTMTDSVALREQEVQGARAKLMADLAALRSPANLAEFTDGLKQ